MLPPPQLPDEPERMQDLLRLGILQTEPEPNFDRIARLAAMLIRSPIGLISLIDERRQWFKARVGLEITETARELAFCAHAIAGPHPFIVLDTLKDERFRDNPLVAGHPGFRFYAGAPLKRKSGSAFGTLCVLDTIPRAEFTEAETEILVELAGIVTEQMEQRLRDVQHDLESRAAAERSSLRRRLYDTLQSSQNRFIGGAESEEVFGRLIQESAKWTGSMTGCLAKIDAESGSLRILAREGDGAFTEATRQAVISGEVVIGTDSVALVCRHGSKIVGVIAWSGGNYSLLQAVLPELEPFLRGLGGLMDAARARREGRKNAETIRLRERALSSINSAVTIVDPRRDRGTIIYCNSAFERMSGYSCDEVAGRDLTLLYGPETSQEAAAEVQDAFRTGSSLESLFRNYHRNGRVFWSRLRLSPVSDPSGNVEYFVTVADDVTEEIELQAELRRAVDLAEANANSQSRFVANMSHEIRTPMNAVIGMTSLLLDTDLTPEQRDYAETIRASGDGLLTIINEILDFSRIGSRKMTMERIEFDLRNCVESALDLIAATAARKSIDVAYLLDPGMPASLLGDVTRLRQVLINLLGNAVKFTEAGSILLTAAGSRCEGNNWEIQFSVKDTGIGVPANRLDDIFKPFQQADSSSTRRFGGTGLGLAIGKHLAELMGGRMWVESQVGRGSNFHFTIAAQSAGHETAGDIGVQRSDLDGKRAIVVDPNANSRAMLLQHLNAWKMRPSIFASIEEASASERNENFDVVLVDNDIPDLSAEAIERIGGTAPLLLLCSLGRRNQGLAALSAEQSGRRIRLHSKPIKPSNLCDSLVKLLADQPIRVPVRTSPGLIDPTFADRRPCRILVVEDNPVNQKLGLLLLARMGYRADTANNGLEALRSVKRQRYDVIFMDMHMPEMDGIEATRRIRLIDFADERPWIIALTANAMQEDRDLCLSSGMDDFVSKPIQVGDLQRALLAVPVKGAAPVTPLIDSSAAEPAALEVPEYLTQMLTEDPETAAELIQLFLEDTASKLDALEGALSTGDAPRVSRLLHSLKGSSGQMGAIPLARLCAELEPRVLGGDLADCRAALPWIRGAFAEVSSRVRTLRPAGLEV